MRAAARLLISLAAIAAAGLAAPAAADAQHSIRIGASTSMTGTHAMLGVYRLREELPRIRTATAFGEYAVDERGFQAGHRIATIQWRDGTQTVVWPDEVAAARPRIPVPPWSQR